MPGDSLLVQGNADTTAVTQVMMYGVKTVRVHHHGGRLWMAICSVMVVVGGVLLIFAARPLYMRLRGRYHHRNLQKAAMARLDTWFSHYDEALSDYNSYYRSLSLPLRRRFVVRVMEFMDTKNFEYVNIVAEEKMPLLISAAAIQLTFGLDEFLLDFFDTIYVMQHDYHYGMYNVPFAGHVSRNGIYLSWDNFLRGYADDTDGDNVGVHEMAHALAYVNFSAGENEGEDDAFKARFEEFTKVARPLYEDMKQGGSNMLDRYAATNYNEFWAVSVETFFEKTLLMKNEMPSLYTALCELLGQDPLLEGKLIPVSKVA